MRVQALCLPRIMIYESHLIHRRVSGHSQGVSDSLVIIYGTHTFIIQSASTMTSYLVALSFLCLPSLSFHPTFSFFLHQTKVDEYSGFIV